MGGALLEGLVAQHLVAWCEYSRAEATVYFWRTRADLEVDFIVYGEKCFCAIEVKSAKKVSPHDTKALRAFLVDYPNAEAILLYGGNEKLKMGPILCIPVQEFLRNLRPNQPFY